VTPQHNEDGTGPVNRIFSASATGQPPVAYVAASHIDRGLGLGIGRDLAHRWRRLA
jgi:hypothetical protein